MQNAGFDGVDIKSCHRYLLSEILASHTREGNTAEVLRIVLVYY